MACKSTASTATALALSALSSCASQTYLNISINVSKVVTKLSLINASQPLANPHRSSAALRATTSLDITALDNRGFTPLISAVSRRRRGKVGFGD